METSTADIRFSGFGASALTVAISSYILTRDAVEFAAIREDLLLRIMEIVRQSGTALAVPAQTLYLGRDSGLDPEKTATAEKQVQDWREQHQLPFPDFAPTDKAALRGAIPYPPDDSAVQKQTP